MLLAALLAAALLPWSGAAPASASAAGSIEARPYPNDRNVEYVIEFKASEAIKAWGDGGSLTIEFPSAYHLPDGAAFQVEEYGVVRQEILRLERDEVNR